MRTPENHNLVTQALGAEAYQPIRHGKPHLPIPTLARQLAGVTTMGSEFLFPFLTRSLRTKGFGPGFGLDRISNGLMADAMNWGVTIVSLEALAIATKPHNPIEIVAELILAKTLANGLSHGAMNWLERFKGPHKIHFTRNTKHPHS